MAVAEKVVKNVFIVMKMSVMEFLATSVRYLALNLFMTVLVLVSAVSESFNVIIAEIKAEICFMYRYHFSFLFIFKH